MGWVIGEFWRRTGLHAIDGDVFALGLVALGHDDWEVAACIRLISFALSQLSHAITNRLLTG